MMRILIYFVTSRIQVFEIFIFIFIPFGSITIQEPSYLGNIIGVSTRYWDANDPNNDLGIHRYADFVLPVKCQYLTGMTILVLVSRSFGSIVDTVNC